MSSNEALERCEVCGRYFDSGTMQEIDGYGLVCEECLNRHFERCPICGTMVHVETCRYDSRGDFMCDDCYIGWYYTCTRCGEFVHCEDARWVNDEVYCHYCYDEIVEQSDGDGDYIYSYNFKPRFRFYSLDNENESVFYGIELELDDGGEDVDKAMELLNILGEGWYAKHDGSLDDGFELVCHPMSFLYMKENLFPRLEAFCEKAVELGYRSHDAGTCGLHVHVSRAPLSETTIANLLNCIELHFDFFLRFSRRTRSQLERWASRYGDDIYDVIDEIKKNKDATFFNRYRAINLTNDHTVEIRIFRGTLKYQTIIATLSLVDALVRYCIQHDEDTVKQQSDKKFIDELIEISNKNKFLIDYLKERRLI